MLIEIIKYLVGYLYVDSFVKLKRWHKMLSGIQRIMKHGCIATTIVIVIASLKGGLVLKDKINVSISKEK